MRPELRAIKDNEAEWRDHFAHRQPENRPMLRLSLAALMLSAALPAFANDSVAEIGAGGIVLARNYEITLDREDLFLSKDLVTVDYVFQNRSEKDVETIVAFPMPAIAGNPDSDIAVPDQENDNFLGFTVMHDGKAITPELQQRVFAAGVDVTEEFLKAGIPAMPTGEATYAALDKLTPETVADWENRGIVTVQEWDAGKGMEKHVMPRWELRSTYWWKATFPAGKPVKVAHRYKPAVGATAGLNFYWDGNKSDYWDSYADKYCLDDGFKKALDKASKQGDGLFENRLDYILTSGGNWANGTIGEFHLTIDKGSTEKLVSFCGEGVKKTGSTRFEMTAKDFWPEQDIHVLLVERFPQDFDATSNLKRQKPIAAKKDGG